jgi:hypothetical protein
MMIVAATPLAMGTGVDASELSPMKFTLTYDGPLSASANKPKNEEKWAIRKAFDPQLRALWTGHPAMSAIEDVRHFPKEGGAFLMQTHHLHPGPIIPRVMMTPQPPNQELIDLCARIEKHGAFFLPLIRDTFALHCGLEILFLRNEPPGKIYQGGDIDGRIKTLLDALAIPQHSEQILEKSSKINNLIYCLAEDDSLISGINVETERLLSPVDAPKNYVRLVIRVDVRVKLPTIYNQSFL